MKKISLICISTLTCLSLAACGSSHSVSNHQAKVHNEKVAKRKKHKATKKREKHQKQKTVKKQQAVSSSSSEQQAQQSNGDQADPFDASTWDKPYKGYPNFHAYLQAHPDTPNIQSQTAQMQHDENVRRGIEDANGNETQNFKNWEAYRDRAWANGYSANDYDQNIDYSTGQ